MSNVTAEVLLDALLSQVEEDENGMVSAESAERMRSIAQWASDPANLESLADEGTQELSMLDAPPDMMESVDETVQMSTVRFSTIASNPGSDILQQIQVSFGNLSQKAQEELLRAASAGTLDERLLKVADVLGRTRPELEELLAQSHLAGKLTGMQPLAKVASVVVPPENIPVNNALLAEGYGEIRLPLIENAVKNLASRELLSPQQFQELISESKDLAFTVAGIEEEATLARIRDALTETVKKGASLPDFKRRLAEVAEEGSFLSPAHMETVFRTNVQTALSDGQRQIVSHPLVASAFPYARYVAVHDDRARPDHLELEKMGLDGTAVYRADDPVVTTFRTPWDYG